MRFSAQNSKMRIISVLIVVAGALTLQMAYSVYNGLGQTEKGKITLLERKSKIDNHLSRLVNLPESIQGIVNKHIMASTTQEKEAYSVQITRSQNELLDTIYKLDEQLEKEQRSYLEKTKEAVALFITNHSRIQELSFRFQSEGAGQISKNELQQDIGVITDTFRQIRESAELSFQAHLQNLEEERKTIEIVAFIKLAIIITLIIVAVILYLRKSVKRAPHESKPGVKSSTDLMGEEILKNFSQGPHQSLGKEGISESQPQTDSANRSASLKQGAIQRHNAIMRDLESPGSTNYRFGQQSNSASPAKNLLGKAAAISMVDIPDGDSCSGLNGVFDDARKVSGLLQAACKESSSSVAEAQDMAIKIAKVGEYEIRRLVSHTLQRCQEIQQIMVDSFERMQVSLLNAEQTRNELQGIIGNVGKVSQLLLQVDGADEIAESLKNLKEQIGDFDKCEITQRKGHPEPQSEVIEPSIPRYDTIDPNLISRQPPSIERTSDSIDDSTENISTETAFKPGAEFLEMPADLIPQDELQANQSPVDNLQKENENSEVSNEASNIESQEIQVAGLTEEEMAEALAVVDDNNAPDINGIRKNSLNGLASEIIKEVDEEIVNPPAQ